MGPAKRDTPTLGIAAGKHRGHLFIQGQIMRVVTEDEMVEALVDEAKKIIAEGVEARLARARPVSAESRSRSRPRGVARRLAAPTPTTPRFSIDKIRRHAEGRDRVRQASKALARISALLKEQPWPHRVF